MFRRRRAPDDDESEFVDDEYADDDLDDDDADDIDDDDEYADDVDEPADEARRTTGPWDVHDLPKGDATPRIDIGGLALPAVEGVDVNLNVEDNVVVAVTLVDGASHLIVNAFAAPKTSGLWDDVRTEIAESLRGSGGSAEPVVGGFGTELRARIPEGGVTQPARFIGVDGPRWFLRGLIVGPAATDPAQAGRLEAMFRGIVVNRGTDAMAPRDPLPLRLPVDAMEAIEGIEPADVAPQLELRERGPEITEIQ